MDTETQTPHDDPSACTVTVQTYMDLVDTDIHCLHAFGFAHCRLLHIGATEHSVFDREESRVRKYRQLCNQQLAYFEPAPEALVPPE